jgi:hypothetical protein
VLPADDSCVMYIHSGHTDCDFWLAEDHAQSATVPVRGEVPVLAVIRSDVLQKAGPTPGLLFLSGRFRA